MLPPSATKKTGAPAPDYMPDVSKQDSLPLQKPGFGKHPPKGQGEIEEERLPGTISQSEREKGTVVHPAPPLFPPPKKRHEKGMEEVTTAFH